MYTKTNIAEISQNMKILPLGFDWSSKMKMRNKTLTDTGKLRSEICIITRAFCNAVILLIKS